LLQKRPKKSMCSLREPNPGAGKSKWNSGSLLHTRCKVEQGMSQTEKSEKEKKS
jgi:hypothetical protein